MSNEVHIPLDFQGWPEFRLLARVEPNDAFNLWMRLWLELGQLAPVTGAVGTLPKTAQALLFASLGCSQDDGARILKTLVEVNLLKAEGEDYVCPRFAACNPHLAPGYKPNHLKGADVSRFNRSQRRVSAEAQRQALLMPEEYFHTSDGPMDAETVRRVTMLIKTFDNALMKPARATHEFTEGVIQDAHQVLRHFTDEQIDQVAHAVVAKRGHPAMPATTERLLRDFQHVAEGILS